MRLERDPQLGDRRGSALQTDLLAVLGIGDELAVMAVEAKVTESFGPLVSDWIGEGGEGKEDRLQRLCVLLASIAMRSATSATSCSTAPPPRSSKRDATARTRPC